MLDYLAPVAKVLGAIFAFIVTGATSYSALVIKSLKQDTQRMSKEIGGLRHQLDEARLQNAVRVAANDIVDMLRQVGHPKLHLAPVIPPNPASMVRSFPSILNQPLLGLIDGGYIFNRDNVVAFTVEGLHLPKQQSPINWDDFGNAKIETKIANLSIGAVNHTDTFGSADDDNAFFFEATTPRP